MHFLTVETLHQMGYRLTPTIQKIAEVDVYEDLEKRRKIRETIVCFFGDEGGRSFEYFVHFIEFRSPFPRFESGQGIPVTPQQVMTLLMLPRFHEAARPEDRRSAPESKIHLVEKASKGEDRQRRGGRDEWKRSGANFQGDHNRDRRCDRRGEDRRDQNRDPQRGREQSAINNQKESEQPVKTEPEVSVQPEPAAKDEPTGTLS